MQDSIFTKIINRELPSTIRYEDDEFIVFDNIAPQAPIHVLVVPKKQYATLEEVPAEDTQFHGRILQIGRQVAKLLGIGDNYRLVMNVGTGVQAVHHVHLHVLGGWKDLHKAQNQQF